MDTPESYLDVISYQPRVYNFLKGAFESDRLSHAYLFCGSQGAGMQDAAMGLAHALAASTSKMHNPQEIFLIDENQHPDIRIYEPEAAGGYLIDQIRELMGQVEFAPVMCGCKVYIIHDAHRLNPNTANALLKTIEEPPAHTLFIFIAPATDAVLPTIASRCQQVPFPALDVNARAQIVMDRCEGHDLESCKIALSITGSCEDALEYLASAERKGLRRFVIDTFSDLGRMSIADVLGASNTWCTLSRSAFGEDDLEDDEAAADQEEINREYLSRGALTRLEKAHKRNVTSHALSGMIESLVYAELFLRDVLLYNEQVLSDTNNSMLKTGQGQMLSFINTDSEAQISYVARNTSATGVLEALEHIAKAKQALWRSMTPQLTFEVMLVHIKEALYAFGNTR